MTRTKPSAQQPTNLAISSPLDTKTILGLLLLLVPVFVRASTTTSLLPGWDQDPLTVYDPPTGFGPTGSFALDGVMMLGAAMLALRHVTKPTARWGITVALGLLATVCCGLFFRDVSTDPNAMHNARIATTWISSVIAALTLAAACRHTQIRRIALACTLGFIALLAIRAGVQVFVDHPIVVADFKARREEIFASRGWTPDSTMARTYERRLLQPDASAWFGLSNVLASFAAASAVAFSGLLLISRNTIRKLLNTERLLDTNRVPTLGAWLGLFVSLFALYCTQSKGGLFVVASGLAALALLLAISWWLARRENAAAQSFPPRIIAIGIGLGCIALPIALIALRGLLGPEFGDRSLLFRWYYLTGATRIFADNPFTGVGAEGFQQTFMRAKPPLCPEDVTSPHSILFDYFASLGLLGGGVLALAFVTLAVIIAKSPWRGLLGSQSHNSEALRPPQPQTTTSFKPERQSILLIAAFATAAAAMFERGNMTPEMASTRIVGLIAWGGLGVLLLPLLAWFDAKISQPQPSTSTSKPSRSAFAPHALLAFALAPSALALIAHAQIEVTASWGLSCALFFAWIGAIAGLGGDEDTSHQSPASANESTPNAASAQQRLFAIAGPCIAVSLCAFVCAIKVWGWESNVRHAANSLHTVAMYHLRLQSAQRLAPHLRAPEERQIFADLNADLAASGSTQILHHPAGSQIADALTRLTQARLTAASTDLQRALSALPNDWRTRRALSEIELRLAFIARDQRNTAATTTHADAALKAVTWDSAIPAPSGLLRAVTIVHKARADLLGEGHRAEEDRARLATFEQIALADPFNPDVPYQSFLIARQLSMPDAAHKFAAAALELQKQAWLDPLARGLSDAQVAELSRFLSTSTAPQTPAPQ